MAATWIDLLDPTREELRAKAPRDLEETAIERLLAPPEHEDEPRPTLQGHGDYVFGVFLIASPCPRTTASTTRRSTWSSRTTRCSPCARRRRRQAGLRRRRRAEDGKPDDSAGLLAYRLLDEIAERYLDLVDALDDEIDELEDKVEDAAGGEHPRPHLDAPTRPAAYPADAQPDARRCASRDRRDASRSTGPEVFPREVEVAFNAAYDKFLRASDGLDLARDLLAGVRDYSQAKIANDQNEVMKLLTVIASLVLLPTFIVGLYGQNFVDIPELRWHFGYAFSWGVIIVTTLVQLWYYRRKRWF